MQQVSKEPTFTKAARRLKIPYLAGRVLTAAGVEQVIGD